MNRYLVLEAFSDHDSSIGDTVRMQVLNIHSSVSAAYWHWTIKGDGSLRRLHLVDLKKQLHYDWSDVFSLMCYEQLLRIESGHTLKVNISAVLQEQGFIDVMQRITDIGHELIAQYRPPPALIVPIGYVQNKSQLYK